MKKVIVTTNAPAAIGPYSQAIEVNGTVYCSGQIPLDPKTGEVIEGGIVEQTKQVLANINAILTEANLSFADVVKTTILLANIADFAQVNEIYGAAFQVPYPARSAFAVKDLPKGVLIEIETIAVR